MVDQRTILPPLRPEIELKPNTNMKEVGDIARPLPLLMRLANVVALRRFLILLALALIWQIYSVSLQNSLIFPAFTSIMFAFFDAIINQDLLSSIFNSLKVLLIGYAVGISISIVLTTLAVSSRLGNDLLSTLTAMFNPLPAIALLPLALLWFGLGNPSLVFVLVHSVLWPMSLNMHSGFLSVSDSLRMAGRNYDLSGIRFVVHILIPAAFPSILAGLKISWAFAWRTLIAAELVFGVSSGSGGLGWFIFRNKNDLEIDYVFAGLGAVIIIGLAVEYVIFRTIEARTVNKWGMQH